MQGVAGANDKFLRVSTGYKGSIHDARVLRMSSLLRAIKNGDILHSPKPRIGGTQVKPLIVADPDICLEVNDGLMIPPKNWHSGTSYFIIKMYVIIKKWYM